MNDPGHEPLLRPASPYEAVAALLHHQPAAAFTSLFVLYGYGHDLCTHTVVAELAAIDTRVSGAGVVRDYRLHRLQLKTLGSDRLLDLSEDPLAFRCFAGCSIRQFPVFFLCRDAAQWPALEAALPTIVGQTTMRFHDWRLENAFEWALICRSALRGELVPCTGFPLMEAVGWRLMRPVTELGGRAPVLEWQLMKLVDLGNPGALPLMTVLTDLEGRILRRTDAQMLTVFRAQSPRRQPLRVALAADRDPLVQVRLQRTAAPPSETGEGLEPPVAADKVVPLQRLYG